MEFVHLFFLLLRVRRIDYDKYVSGNSYSEIHF